ncbi:MAG: PilZ domain-containing protein [Acidobacteria bacterium]|nr:PilZ domain-containing protein [Acidobacteriota bacterium]
MGSGTSNSERRVIDRVVLNRKVGLRFDKFQDFLTEIAGNISPSGMFVRSDDPHAPGEQFDFECSLADGYPLVSGRAEVVWVRRLSTSENQPSGMGVRFLALKDKSEVLIRRIVEERIEAGEEPFELDDVSSAARIVGATATQGLSDEILAASERLIEQVPTPASSDGPATDAASQDHPDKTLQASPKPADQSKLPVRGVSPVPIPASLREQARTAAPSLPLPEPTARAGGTRPARRPLGLGRFLELLVFSLLAGVCMVLIFNQFWVRPRIESLEAKLGELTGSSQIGGPPGFQRAIEVEKEKGEPRKESPLVADMPLRETVRRAVKNWARAWSERHVDDYLSFYSEDFRPASGVTRAVWEARRRDRLVTQGAIRVAVVLLEVEEVSPTEMRVTFTQSYQSDRFRDRVRKTLRMSWNDDAWKIAEEIVVRQLPW